MSRRYANGNPKFLGWVTNGLPDKTGVGWYENGQINSLITHIDGMIDSVKTWQPNGVICPDTNIEMGTGVRVYYNEDGTISREVKFIKGESIDTTSDVNSSE
jgi:antitoxin component YwqK of YwqJK toxin-antitoxin module